MGANENTAADPAAQRTPLHKTTALCPDCLDELPAEVYADAEGAPAPTTGGWPRACGPTPSTTSGCARSRSR